MSPALAALLLVQSASGQPPAAWTSGDWLVVYREQDAVLAVDRVGLRRDGAMVSGRMRADFAQLNRGVRWGLVTFEIDCARHTIRSLNYSEYGPDGVRTGGRDEPEAEARATPDRIWIVYGNICEAAGWRAQGAVS